MGQLLIDVIFSGDRGCENGKICVWTVEQPRSNSRNFFAKSHLPMESQVFSFSLFICAIPTHTICLPIFELVKFFYVFNLAVYFSIPFIVSNHIFNLI